MAGRGHRRDYQQQGPPASPATLVLKNRRRHSRAPRMTQRVNLPSPAQVVLIRQGLLLGDPGEGTGEGAGDGAGGSFSREDSVSAGVNGRAETTHSAVGCGTCVSITSQAGGLGPAPVEPEAAQVTPFERPTPNHGIRLRRALQGNCRFSRTRIAPGCAGTAQSLARDMEPCKLRSGWCPGCPRERARRRQGPRGARRAGHRELGTRPIPEPAGPLVLQQPVRPHLANVSHGSNAPVALLSRRCQGVAWSAAASSMGGSCSTGTSAPRTWTDLWPRSLHTDR